MRELLLTWLRVRSKRAYIPIEDPMELDIGFITVPRAAQMARLCLAHCTAKQPDLMPGCSITVGYMGWRAGGFGADTIMQLKDMIRGKKPNVPYRCVVESAHYCEYTSCGAQLTGPSTMMNNTLSNCPHNVVRAIVTRHAANHPEGHPLRSHPDRRLDQNMGENLIKRVMPEIVAEYEKQLEKMMTPVVVSHRYNKKHLKRAKRYRVDLPESVPFWAAKFKTKRMMDMLFSFLLGERYAYNIPRNGKITGQCASFIKYETYRKSAKDLVKARLISGYYELYTQYVCGPYVYSAQEAFSHVLRDVCIPYGGSTYHVTMACGMNADDIGEWMDKCVRDKMMHFFECDGSSWDATMDKADYNMFARLMKPLVPEWVIDSINANRVVRSVADFRDGFGTVRVKSKLVETTKSGHLTTTLANTLARIAIGVTAAHRYVQSRGKTGNFRVIAMGDDWLLASDTTLDAEELMLQEQYMNKRPGGTVYSGPAAHLDVSFISGTWLNRINNTHIFIPKPGRLLSGLAWTTSPIPTEEVAQFLPSVLLGLNPVVKELPILRTFFAEANREPVSERMKRHSDSYWDRKIQYKTREVTPVAPDPHWFNRKYGLTDNEIENVESWLRNMPSGPCIVRHHALDKIVATDLADPEERYVCEV